MALDTTVGGASAESYCSVAQANTYHSKRGNTDWEDLDTLDKEAALRKASDYLMSFYRPLWKGYRVTTTQRLDWPRYDVTLPDTPGTWIENDEVPEMVINACAELALRATTAKLAPDVQREVKREKVGSLETEYASGPQWVRYREIDAMLAPLLRSGNATGTVRLVRG